jgi:hypothetical protein
LPLPIPLDGEIETQLQLSLAIQVETPFDVTGIFWAPELEETVVPEGTDTVQIPVGQLI